MKTLALFLFVASSVAHADQTQCKKTMEDRLSKIEKNLSSGQVKPIQVSADGRTLYVTGEIRENMARAFAALTSAQKAKIQFVVLNSPGGQIVSANPIARWVHSRHNSLKVVVPSEGICASACTTIFRCAWDRSANINSYLLFHPASMNQEGRSKLRQRWGQLGDLMGEAFAVGVTALDENDECAKTDQSSGTKKISGEILKGREFCHRADELKKIYPDFLDLEHGGMLDDVSDAPGVHTIK